MITWCALQVRKGRQRAVLCALSVQNDASLEQRYSVGLQGVDYVVLRHKLFGK